MNRPASYSSEDSNLLREMRRILERVERESEAARYPERRPSDGSVSQPRPGEP